MGGAVRETLFERMARIASQAGKSKMELFSVVDEADAIIRLPKGVHKQTKVYHRGGKLYIPHSGGYVRIVPTKWDETYSTGHPDIKVVEIEGPGIGTNGRELTFSPKGK